MVSRTEIEAITIVAEERERQADLQERERTREKTREYCSTVISDQLKEEANKPSRCLTILVTVPDKDREVHIIKKDEADNPYYSAMAGFYNVDTLIEFTREHKFDVKMSDSTYRYNRNTTLSCKKISIEW